MAGIGLEPVGDVTLAAAPQDDVVVLALRSVGRLEPHARTGRVGGIAIERIDQVGKLHVVGAGDYVERETKLRRIGERTHADQRIGADGAPCGTQRHIVDGIEDGDLAAIVFALGVEHGDGALDDVAQTGALALGEVADGVLHILRGVTVAGEDGLVDVERIGRGIAAAEVGVGQKGIVEDEGQFVVGDDRMVGARERTQGERDTREETEERFHDREFFFIMLRTVMLESRNATRAKAAVTTMRSEKRNSTG